MTLVNQSSISCIRARLASNALHATSSKNTFHPDITVQLSRLIRTEACVELDWVCGALVCSMGDMQIIIIGDPGIHTTLSAHITTIA